jgi:hypothetical protein
MTAPQPRVPLSGRMEEIRGRLERATPGDWRSIKGIVESDEMRCGVTVERDGVHYLLATIENGAPGDFCKTEEANAEFISHSKSDIAFLLELGSEADDLQRTFDLRWAADMRAIKIWQAAGEGRELTWPDHADLVVFLLGQIESSRAEEREACARALQLFHDAWADAKEHPEETTGGYDKKAFMYVHYWLQKLSAIRARATKGG